MPFRLKCKIRLDVRTQFGRSGLTIRVFNLSASVRGSQSIQYASVEAGER